MEALVLNDDGRALIFDRVTQTVMTCSVATATENVANGKGRYVHGSTGEPLEDTDTAPSAEPVIALRQDDVLPLPPAEQPDARIADLTADRDVWKVRAETAEAKVADLEAQLSAKVPVEDAPPAPVGNTTTSPLDHDGDGKPGGSKPRAQRSPEEEAERAALFATFKELDVKVFAGSTTEALRAKLAELEAATAP